VRRTAAEIRIDGRLDEPAWEEATPIPLDYEWYPGDNAPPPVDTEALIAHDSDHLFIAFKAYDPNPSQIRAHLMDRDSIDTFVQDDHVTFMIDTFNDQRRAFQFRVNPLGVQADAVFSEVELVEDFSWDIIWDSAGRITDWGYAVEVAVPLDQLRFPHVDGEQTWGIELGRSYPRGVRHRIVANRRDRDNTCVLCQVDKLTGFEGLRPGHDLEIDPTLTATRTDTRTALQGGRLEAGEEELEPGVTGRWGITSALTLSAAVNPDFSQVEADAPQLEVNERFALFFPEKRPFFLEGIDLFATPLDAIFTRTVVDPEWGLKLTGKQSRHAMGVFVTADEVNSLVIPSNQGSAFAFLEDEVTSAVGRYRRDVGKSSNLGVLYAGREGDDYHNRVGGFDGFFRIGEGDEIRFQLLRSETLYPDAVTREHQQPAGSFSGNAARVAYDHTDRTWFWGASYEDLDESFRADSGFIPRVDVRTANAYLVRRFWGGEDDWFTAMRLGLNALRSEDQRGRLTDQSFDVTYTLEGPRQSVLELSVERTSQRFLDTLYEGLVRGQAFFVMQPGSVTKFSIFADLGETIDFSNDQPADLLLLRPSLELKLGRRLNVQLDHYLQRLRVAGGELSEANLSNLRVVYNFNVRTFVRAILQLRDVERDPGLFIAPVDRENEELFTQLLFSYKLNPQTVLFLGYSDNYAGTDQIDRVQTDRTFFVKVGYAFVL
jgi:hypothetical protein